MLNNLIKLDFKWINKIFLPIAGIDLACAALSRAFISIDSPFGSFMRHFLSSVAITLLFSLSINVFIRGFVGFKRKIYGDESYLTHTLPVSKRILWASKVLAIFASILPVALVVALSLLLSDGFDGAIFTSLKLLVKHFGAQTFLTSLLVFLEICFIELSILTGILLGHKHDSHKRLFCVIYSISLYLGFQLLLLGLLFLLSKFSNNFAMLFKTDANFDPNANLTSAFNVIIFFVLVYYLIANTSLYLLGQKTLESGIDTE